jgi:hypothetical protein
MTTLMRQALNALLPRGSAWNPRYGGGLDRLLDGIADCFEILRSVSGGLADLRHPLTSSQLEDLEREFGVSSDAAATDRQRRAYLNGVVYGPIGTGDADTMQARLRAAGFDVSVYQNDPVEDPNNVFAAGTWAECDDANAICDGDLALCGAYAGMILRNACFPYEDLPPDPHFWPFVFFVGGERTGWNFFVDWNMEFAHAEAWTRGGSCRPLTKTFDPCYPGGGIRSLVVEAFRCDIGDQSVIPDQYDLDLLSFYRAAPSFACENLARMNILRDGNMERDGVAAWAATTATLTKEGNPHSGSRCLRIVGDPGCIGEAGQPALLSGRSYLMAGYARSVDGVTVPLVKRPGSTLWTGTNSTDWQEFTVAFKAGGGSGDLALTMDANAGSVEFDQCVLVGTSWFSFDATVNGATDLNTPWVYGLTPDLVPGPPPPPIELCMDCVYNGGFDALPSLGWVEGDGWTINAGVAEKRATMGAGPYDLETDLLGTRYVPNVLYRLTYTVMNNVGPVDVTPYVGGTAGTQRIVSGTFTEIIRCGLGDTLLFSSTAIADFDLDDVTLESIDEVFASTNLTIETIIKFADPETATYQGVVSNSGVIGDGDEQYLAVYRGYIRWGCVVGGVAREIASTELAMSRDDWYHVVATREYDGTDTTLTLFVDGVIVGNGSWAGAPDTTSFHDPVIGQMDAARVLDGSLADHIAFYASAWDYARVNEAYDAAIVALKSGPSASQVLDESVHGPLTLRVFAWSRNGGGIADGIPVVVVRTAGGQWRGVWAGLTAAVETGRQDVDIPLQDGIAEIMLLTKGSFSGRCLFDDVRIDDVAIATASVPAVLREKFENMIASTKPLHTWAGLLVSYD